MTAPACLIAPILGRRLFTAFFASATSTAATITAPAGILAGDLILLQDVANGSPVSVTPTGFTLINDQVSGTERAVISLKKAVGTEGGTAITGMNDTDMRKVMLVFRPSTPCNYSVSAVGTQGTDADPAAQTVAAGAGVAPLIVFGSYSVQSAGTVDPRTFTVAGVAAKDGEVSALAQSYFAYKIYNSSPQDVVIDMADEGNNNILNSFYISMTPA